MAKFLSMIFSKSPILSVGNRERDFSGDSQVFILSKRLKEQGQLSTTLSLIE
ncbi:hypothetical protein [Thermodesulfatator atlanticus]|uniref:hypothetical protein n=1 Tax=Thermodesulfatator atlanticus TaxID=501497 RepID=UPI0012F72BB6|nr:hypothetical protein [Thermodesulfatator atlanticus]